MTLIPNWASILKGAWSLRFTMLSAFFAMAEVALPFFTTVVPPRTMALLAIAAAAGSAVSRVVAQPALHTNDNSTPTQ